MRSLMFPFGTGSSACLLLASALLTGCVHAPAGPQALGAADERLLFDFEGGTVPAEVRASNAVLDLVPVEGGSALRGALHSRENVYTGITFEGQEPWDWSGGLVAGLAIDIGNPGPLPVQLNLEIADARGASLTRSVVVPVGPPRTYYAPLKGPDLATETGLRDDPDYWRYPGAKFIWMWGTKQLDLTAVDRVALTTASLAEDRSITIDNVRIVRDPAVDPSYLAGIVDRWGQAAKLDFPGKIRSDEELRSRSRAELDALSGEALPDRSRFGGWKAGPRLEGTGYFRTARHEGKWTLVDPEGYLFFSTGIANVRMANLSSLTGADFDSPLVGGRDQNDITPEDSTGLNPVPRAAFPGRFIASELRRDMFEWLPDYEHPLGDHFGYRREVHSGAMKKGETYSFYRANLERKYGEEYPGSYMDRWRDVTIARMRDWGFTSFGNWLSPDFYRNEQVPYFANGWIIGGFKTVSSGDDYWAPLPDPFDPLFAERARMTARTVAAEVKGSPWCIGVFIDNEKSWGRMGTPEGQYGIVINTLARDAADSPAKAAFDRLLRARYGTIGKLNAAWSSNFASWDELGRGVTLRDHGAVQQADYALLLEAFASQYFEVVRTAVKEVMPNHLYMGVRFATWGMTPEVIAAARRQVDVMSYNEYREIPHADSWAFLAEVDKPSIIGEFHMGAADSGLFHPGLVHAVDQADRARMFERYMAAVIDNPWFVGAHWFQYVDSPTTGRAYDGENYNVGFVSVADVPYPEMTDAARRMNQSLYTRRFGSLRE